MVIPTLNEAEFLERTVAALRRGTGVEATAEGDIEVVVTDSGSADGTVDLARRLGTAVVEAPAAGLESRAAACNRGAAVASGEVLLFLDADVLLPDGWRRAVLAALEDAEVVAGAFELRLDGPEAGLRRVEAVNRLRYRASRLFYGDQALFVRRAGFRAVGGFPEVPVLESARLCKRLKWTVHPALPPRRGRRRLALLPLAVLASDRRFRAGGLGPVFRQDLAIWARSLLRLGPGTAGRRYWEENRRRGATRPGQTSSQRPTPR